MVTVKPVTRKKLWEAACIHCRTHDDAKQEMSAAVITDDLVHRK